MKRTAWGIAVLLAFFALAMNPRQSEIAKPAAAQTRQTQAREVPEFQVETSWEKLPSKWFLGPVEGASIDAQGHIWVLHRPGDTKSEEGRVAAPPVLEFDAGGNVIQAWGGPGEGYEWPGAEHGLFVDYKGYVWITGSGTDPAAGNDQIVKFTQDGKFVLQIGHKGQGKGNTDRDNMRGPSTVSVYPKTNEVVVADGFFNRRVIVFDADTGEFKRMWGAFGIVPTDPPKSAVPYRAADGVVAIPPEDNEGPGPPQFSNVHGLGVSSDGLVYVCDKGNRRIQVFTVAGKYLNQVFISRDKLPPSTLTGIAFGKPRRELADVAAQSPTSAGAVAFSPDPQQRFMYVADRRRAQVLIYERKTLEYLGAFGDGAGDAPGQFFQLHGIAADSKGNVYTTEESPSPSNNRVQKWVLEGMSPAPSK
jgi:hypothetical protein